MKKQIITLLLAAGSLAATAQVGLNCQYLPGVQFGSVKVKTNNALLGEYKYGAALPLMMLDRVGNKWYWNMDMNALYYGATQGNKANSGKIKIAKTEGGYFSMRAGRVFGKGEVSRVGFSVNFGWSASNLDSSIKVMDPKGYTNMGLGAVYYHKFGKIRFVGRLGYEKLASKKYITKGSGLYLETTFAYKIYQKFGLSLSPCWYSKKFTYEPDGAGAGNTFPAGATEAKVKSIVFRFGITKFL